MRGLQWTFKILLLLLIPLLILLLLLLPPSSLRLSSYSHGQCNLRAAPKRG